jgi:hypothetical protein
MDFSLDARIKCFIQLGLDLNPNSNWYQENIATHYQRIYFGNGWFTEANIANACSGLNAMLQESNMIEWLSAYLPLENKVTKKVAIIMAGNIPLVGFHDLLCVLISGHSALLKLSSDDAILPKIIIQRIKEIEPRLNDKIEISESKLEHFDAVIATGSNNTARYFEVYFGKYPHIIRKSRTSVAVLSGNESKEDLEELGKDILDYFGLGCRNVSKLFVPMSYSFDALFEAVYEKREVINVNKYASNYDYNRAVYLMNSVAFLDNNFMMIKEGESLHTPVSVIHFEYYSELENVLQQIKEHANDIQCVVSKMSEIENAIPFGNSQVPMLWDYADKVDTMKFLLGL